ncbi:MAG: hypothetical protein RIQ50_1172 [Bacteroidota bacterium]
MPKNYLFAIFLLTLSVTTTGQHKPRTHSYALPKNDFYTHLFRQAKNAPSISWAGLGQIVNDYLDGIHSSRFTQELLVANDKLYLFLSSTGRLYEVSDYKNDDSVRLIRMDTTSLMGYNINAYAFSQGDSIFNIGGYGFWRWNGHLRIFNPAQNEWDVVPLNKELALGVYSPNGYIWNDKKHRALYAFNYFIGNNGVRIGKNKDFEFIDSVCRLDIRTGDWITLGKLNPRFVNEKIKYMSVAELDSGLLLDNMGTLEYWNVISNKVKVFENKPKRQQINTKTINCYLWYVYPYLYYGSSKSGRVDSIHISHADFRELNEPVYIPTKLPFKWWWLLIVPAVGVVGWAIAQRRRKPGLKATGPALKFNLRSPSANLNLFDEVEKALLHLLLKNMNEKGLRTDADQINRVIGVAGSTLNMQKRKRSDVIRSINTKYNNRFPDREHPLINREKSEQDARLFEYYISESNAHYLASILPH